MKTIAVIPARYASTRMPGKPLADVLGKPMIYWVYKAARACPKLDDVLIATDDERIATVAPPIMGQLLQRVVWPSDLTTPDGDAMIIRETTHRFSPLSFHRSMVGRRLPILLTAAGRAYFSMCPEAEREDILEVLRSGAGGEQQLKLALDDTYIRNLVRQTRTNGFGSNHGDWSDQRKIGALAVAIEGQGRVLASLNVVYLEQAISPAEAVRRFVPELQRAAVEMAAALHENEMASPGAG